MAVGHAPHPSPLLDSSYGFRENAVDLVGSDRDLIHSDLTALGDD